MSQHANRIDQAREIFVRFDGVVPKEVLRPFIQALVHSDQPALANGRSEGPWDRIFVHGTDPTDTNTLLFIPLGTALQEASIEASSADDEPEEGEDDITMPPRYDPKVAMHGTVPASIETEFATLGDGLWDGPYVEYRKEDLKAILRAFEDLGFLSIEDQFLIDSIYGFAGSFESVKRRKQWYDEMEGLFEGP